MLLADAKETSNTDHQRVDLAVGAEQHVINLADLVVAGS
jgi:hypothetical protein